MSVIQIRKAQREGARVVCGFAGRSGDGKTYTALQFAYGLANYDPTKIGFLDTENKRGSLYADIFHNHPTHPTKEQFLIGDLHPPFTPNRYMEAIAEFQRAGVEVLIIDSVTHEWEGAGGCVEIAGNATKQVVGWNLAKKEHKRFMNAMLQCDMHIIACIRAREMMDFTNPDKPVSLGVLPVQEKNFMFEMTASVLMMEEGKSQKVLKCPEKLRPFLGRRTDYITSEDGKAVRDWVDGAKQLNPEVERFRNMLQSITEQGIDKLREAWGAVPKKIKNTLGKEFLDTLVASAKAYDEARNQGGESATATAGAPAPDGGGIAALNRKIANGEAKAGGDEPQAFDDD